MSPRLSFCPSQLTSVADTDKSATAVCTELPDPVNTPGLATQARLGNGITEREEKVRVEQAFSSFRNYLLDVLRYFHIKWDGHLSHVKETCNRIELQKDSPAVVQTLHCAEPAQRQTELSHERTMLDLRVIEEATADWASSNVMVSKKNGIWRFSV